MLAMSKKKLSETLPPAQELEAKKKDQHKSPNMVRLETDVYEDMKALAKENDRPLTREIRQALIAWLVAKGKRQSTST